MAASITDPRYAHAEGYTAVAFGKSGQFLCTGGSDSLVRVFYASKSERDQEAITLEQHSDNVLSLSVSKSKAISGDEEGMVFSFDLGSTSNGISVEPAGTVLRSILPARDISISGNEKQVAIATDDENVRVVSLLDMALLHTLVGHRGPVNSVSFSPDSAFLASTGCDGTLRVWDMRDDEPTCVHVGNKLSYVCEPGNSMEQYKARWSPDGRFIAIPGADNSIKLVERSSWDVTASLAGVHSKTISHLAWSSNSRYIASVGLDSKVVVWDVSARKSILSQTTATTPCQVDWNPRCNMLAFTDSAGALFIWDDVVPVEQGHAPPFERSSSEHGTLVNEKQQPDAAQSGRTANGNSDLMSDLFDDTAAVDGAAEDDMEEDILDAGEETADVLDDFVVDDDGAGYTEHQAPRWTVVHDPETHSFQPGSTPWINNRRYLAFNMVGSVVSIAQDASYNTIEVEFYDKSMHRDFHFSDSFKFSMAALSDSGCLFATTSREFANDQSLRGTSNPDEASVISYRAFASWSTNTDWVFKMPAKEHPRCIAASSHGAATHSFQPGSTPWINNRRYLAFNMVGSVVSIAQDASYNTIEVEFYDKSMHRDFHFSDSFKFSMAAVSDSGCLFATTSREFANDQSLRGTSNPDEASVISYRAFASWSTNTDWVFKMPAKEHPRCIAASSHGAAVITSLGMLRCFTCGGAQCHVESLPNRVVTCVAHKDLLLIVLESPGSIKSSTGAKRLEYEYILMSISGQSRLATGSCPVTPSSEVVWAGFSEEGHPSICDSKGMLRVLHRYWVSLDAVWVPILDSRALSHDRGKREAYWPVAISAKQFIVVTCKSKARYPPFPKPILDELDVDIPLLQTDSQVGQQEAKYLSEKLFYEQQCGEAQRAGDEYPGGAAMQARDELEQDKLLLRLIQLSCKADRTQRAMDLALMIRQERSFDAAIKIAVFQKQSSLAERLMRLKESRFAGDIDDDEDDLTMPADTRSDEDEEEQAAAASRLKSHARPAATYGRKREQDINDSHGEDNAAGGNEGDESEEDEGRESGGDAVADYAKPPRLPSALRSGNSSKDAPVHSALDNSSSSSSDLVARPTRPPTTSKPFNPFGVATPSKSMEIRRSDSFFNAVDLHSAALSQESSGSTTPAVGGMAVSAESGASAKRQQPQEDEAAPRKQAKKSGKDRAQTKLSAFAFKKGEQHPGAGDEE
ncbi:hypothetical protein GQ54DRAFT_332692 [Martensiomyces pterosporus]|nr:hypothetical protein GQ54DRAFT_332692 [Martensiomyces pterosporus]